MEWFGFWLATTPGAPVAVAVAVSVAAIAVAAWFIR